MRLFTAIKVAKQAHHSLAELQPAKADFISLTPSSHWHITLCFIGEANANDIHDLLSDIDFSAFELTLNKPGCFRNRHQTSTLWLGVDPHPQLIQLHTQVETALRSQLALAHEPRYIPHVTLARCKQKYPQKNIDAFLAQPSSPIKLFVNQFILYQSTLTSEGPHYHELHHYPVR